ncbi:MAG: tRNA1(Val) (adenine(37)-N6)-methyltransferase [Dissulfurispiraceae bacterium]
MITLDSILDIQLYQHKSGYRFSADAVLLSVFVDTPRLKKIADFGAGSGIIGLLLAKKYHAAEVTLIELQKSLVSLAEKNAVLNGLDKRVKVVHADIKDVKSVSSEEEKPRNAEEAKCEHKKDRPGNTACSPREAWKLEHGMLHSYDLVVSNPPFRKTRTGLISPYDERAVARHEIHLPIAALMKSALLMLKHHGRLCIIHLPERLAEIMESMRRYYLEPKRLRFVHSNFGAEAKMVLIEAVKEGKAGLKVEKPLYLYTEDGNYTAEVRAIYNRPLPNGETCDGL